MSDNLKLGQLLAERRKQLERDLGEAQVYEAVNPDKNITASEPTSSASIQAALDLIDGHEAHKAYLEDQARAAEIAEAQAAAQAEAAAVTEEEA